MLLGDGVGRRMVHAAHSQRCAPRAQAAGQINAFMLAAAVLASCRTRPFSLLTFNLAPKMGLLRALSRVVL